MAVSAADEPAPSSQQGVQSPLTSVALNYQQASLCAVKRLTELIERPRLCGKKPYLHVQTPALVVRESA